eukprot:COSAG03_NODE_980_length_5128_cov_1.552197_2_plen_58_part_00
MRYRVILRTSTPFRCNFDEWKLLFPCLCCAAVRCVMNADVLILRLDHLDTHLLQAMA